MSAIPTPRPAGRRKGERTAERILDAAEALFAERGYAGTTLRDVAEQVGLRVPSLYNHFPDQESLYAAVLARGIGPVLAMLSEHVEPGDERDREALIERAMEWLGRHPHLPRLVQHETLAGGQRLTPMLEEWIGPIFARSRELVEESATAARWTPDQVPLLVLAMYHVVVGYFTIAPMYRELGAEDPLSRTALERQTRFLRDLVSTLF